MAEVDCLVIGGGPAGLTAAIYAARYRLSVLVIDAGASRALPIPCIRNHAGFPDGIPGAELLRRMRDQAGKFGVAFEMGKAESLTPAEGGGFVAEGSFGGIAGRAVLLATGVSNRRPPMDDDEHAEAVSTGRIRYCPVCDGYEVTDQRVAVFGTGDHGVREAAFLRAYTSDLTLVAPDGAHRLSPEQRARMERLGVRLAEGPITALASNPAGIEVRGVSGTARFDTLYPALGSVIHSDLARALGAGLTGEGCIKVDAHQRTSIPGLYAAGDVVVGLDQISHAMGEAGVAATTLRNDIAARTELIR